MRLRSEDQCGSRARRLTLTTSQILYATVCMCVYAGGVGEDVREAKRIQGGGVRGRRPVRPHRETSAPPPQSPPAHPSPPPRRADGGGICKGRPAYLWSSSSQRENVREIGRHWKFSASLRTIIIPRKSYYKKLLEIEWNPYKKFVVQLIDVIYHS